MRRRGITPISTTVSLDTWIQVPFEWDDYEARGQARALRRRTSGELLDAGGGAGIAQDIDSYEASAGEGSSTSNFVGVLGTDPTTVATYYQARAMLEREAASEGKRCVLMSVSQMVAIGSNITNVFQPPRTRDPAHVQVGHYSASWADSTCTSRTRSTRTPREPEAGVVKVSGSGQSGASLVIQGTAGDTIMPGDKFSIAAVVLWSNPMTYRSAGPLTLRAFTCPAGFHLDRRQRPHLDPASDLRAGIPIPRTSMHYR